MTHANNLIVVGTLGAVYGVKGWMRINSFTETMDSIFHYSPWFIQVGGSLQELKVINWRPHTKSYVAQLEGINSPEQAQRLVNQEILIDTHQLLDLDEGDYYWKDLMGCEVINLDGYHMGVVTEILETGSNDVLRVKANKKDAYGKQERLIPFVDEQFIVAIDLHTKKIQVNWQPDF